jgi:regulatory protein
LQPPSSLKGRALRWLAQREYSRAELERKLHRWLQAQARLQSSPREREPQHQQERRAALTQDPAATPVATPAGSPAARLPGPADVARVLDQLAAAGLLSDERAAASVLHSQAARSGQRRLQQLLQAKGLPEELVQHSLAAVRGTEFDRAWALWQRRYGQPPRNAAERARQQRFLAARGFDFDIVGRVFRQAGTRLDDQETPPDA